MEISAKGIPFKKLNELIRSCGEHSVVVTDATGERFLACGLSDKSIKVYGTPGNALASYLDGAEIEVYGNAQDAVGDTMNDGEVIIHGNAGDALGYAMRGGRIFVEGDAGYRCGVHIKEYEEKKPVVIIGGTAGSFLGEYMAGGIIVVLNKNDAHSAVGNFTGVGMHGGKIFIRGSLNAVLPPQVKCEKASQSDIEAIKGHLTAYAKAFSLDENGLLQDEYFVLTPDSTNPYKRLYTVN